MRKLSITLMAILIAALVLSACGGATPAAPTAQPAQSQPEPTSAPAEPTAAPAEPTAVMEPTAATEAKPTMEHTPGMESDTSYDVHFIDSILDHHAGVIAMSEQALKESQSVAVKDLAQKSMTTAQKEIDQLKAWRTEWHPNAAKMTDEMDMGATGISTDTSVPFDKRFAAAMIEHHQGSIQMAKEGLPQLEHPELKQFAQDMLASEEAEIAEYQKLAQ